MRFFLPLLALALSLTSTAQPTWRFHLAFEDGTGARDTIWMVYDTTATLGSNPWPGPNVDTLFGEGRVNINDGLFHVFRTNAIGDTTQTNAFPYTQFPNFDGTIVDAINWVPPMTITWDTSLFHTPYLPYGQGNFNQAYLDGNYFFFHSNDGSKSGFNMLITDSVVVDEDAQYLFPFDVHFSGAGSTIGIGEAHAPEYQRVWPNPACHWLHFPLAGGEARFTVHDQLGRLVHSEMLGGRTASHAWDISSLPPGSYHITLETPHKATRHAHFQKVE